jgi:hypothetical protein
MAVSMNERRENKNETREPIINHPATEARKMWTVIQISAVIFPVSFCFCEL